MKAKGYPSEVNASNKMISNKVHEHKNHGKHTTVIDTSADDQIDTSIIFDDPFVKNNGGSDEHDSNAHDSYHDVKILAYNALREAENQKQVNNDLKKQKMLLQQELETCFKEREDRYLEDIVDLDENLSSHDRIITKMGQSIQTIMLRKTPNKVYDPFLKAGLGYKNPEHLKKAIAAQSKMYHAIIALRERIDATLLEDRKRRWMSDTLKQELMEEVHEMLNIFESIEQKVEEKSPKEHILQTKIDRLLDVSLIREIQDCVLFSIAQQKNVLLENEIVKISNDSKDIQANLLKRIKILEKMRIRVGSFNRVRMPKSKDTKSKNNALKNTNAKSSSAYVRKMSSSVRIDSNKRETNNSDECQSNANSRVKRAIFTSSVVAKSRNLRATSVVAKSRFSMAKTPTATNKVSTASTLSPESKQSRTLSNYMKNKIATSRKWQKRFEYQHRFNWTPKSKTAQSQSSETKSSTSVCSNSNTPITTQKWVAKLCTLPSAFVSCDADDPAHPLDFCFENDHFTAIIGYGDYVQGNLTICHVYYVEGLGHNLFSVGQFCDGDLEIAFRSNTCYVWNLEGDDLLTGSQESNLYTISISDLAASSPVCLMSKATSTKSWLWHRMVSHLNFGTINQLTSKDLVDGLLKFKYDKDHLCSAREQGKSKKASFPSKLVPCTESKLELIHMDLCGPMQAPDVIINFNNQVQRSLKAQILKIQTDKGTEFKNEKLRSFYAKLGIVHHTSTARTPQQNGVVERRNRTLVEAARTMLIFSKTLEFLWAEAIATPCFTQNRSIVHTRYNKIPYELIRRRKPNVQYFHVFGSLCYPTNDRDDLGKMKPKADIGIFIGYSESTRRFRICNQPIINCMNFQDSSEDSQSVPSKTDLVNLFGPLYEEYYATSSQEVSDNSAANTLDNENTSSSSSIVVEEDEAPQIVSSSTEQVVTEPNSSVLNENADELVQEDVAEFDGNVFYNPP
ncbi:retrovirus-related pol polyprotein from transposon TNT 1-94 [Tanacetum coccineum]